MLPRFFLSSRPRRPKEKENPLCPSKVKSARISPLGHGVEGSLYFLFIHPSNVWNHPDIDFIAYFTQLLTIGLVRFLKRKLE